MTVDPRIESRENHPALIDKAQLGLSSRQSLSRRVAGHVRLGTYTTVSCQVGWFETNCTW